MRHKVHCRRYRCPANAGIHESIELHIADIARQHFDLFERAVVMLHPPMHHCDFFGARRIPLRHLERTEAHAEMPIVAHCSKVFRQLRGESIAIGK